MHDRCNVSPLWATKRKIDFWLNAVLHFACDKSILAKRDINNIIKLARKGTVGGLLLTANFKVTWRKTRKKIKNPARISFKYCAVISYVAVVIRQPPMLPIINGGRDGLWKWPNLGHSRARELDRDLGSGHTVYGHASLIDLYIHTKFYWNRRNCLWTDERRLLTANFKVTWRKKTRTKIKNPAR